MTSLQSMLQESLLKIATQRKEIFSEWQKINSMVANVPTYSNISLSDCGHFSDGALPCGLCSFERELSIYGSLLSRAPQPSDYVIEDVWVKSWTQSVVDVVCQFAKKNQLPLAIQEQGKRHIGQFCDLLNEIQVNLPEYFGYSPSFKSLFRTGILEMVDLNSWTHERNACIAWRNQADHNES